MKVKFHKEEESRAGKVFLVLNYMSGDADGDFPEEIELEGVKFAKELELSQEHSKTIKDYKLVGHITNCNHAKYSEDYEEIKEEHGEEIASLWENGTNDPQSDYSIKCHLNHIFLRGYDQNGTVYETQEL